MHHESNAVFCLPPPPPASSVCPLSVFLREAARVPLVCPQLIGLSKGTNDGAGWINTNLATNATLSTCQETVTTLAPTGTTLSPTGATARRYCAVAAAARSEVAHLRFPNPAEPRWRYLNPTTDGSGDAQTMAEYLLTHNFGVYSLNTT